jgi:hypothetical protein
LKLDNNVNSDVELTVNTGEEENMLDVMLAKKLEAKFHTDATLGEDPRLYVSVRSWEMEKPGIDAKLLGNCKPEVLLDNAFSKNEIISLGKVELDGEGPRS